MRERLLLPALYLVMIITAIVSGLGTPLLPQMVSHYGVPLQQAQWVLTMPMLVGAVMSPLIGKLGGPGRQRPVILVCLSLVTIGLVLSNLPLGFEAMIAGRALQGIGLALTPVVLAIARSSLSAEASLPAVANLSAAIVAGAGLSYPLSSLFAGLAGIPGVYGTGAILSLITLCLVWYVLPKHQGREAMTVDWLGAAILAGGSGALLLLLSQLHSWTPLMSIAVGLASAVLVAMWVRRSLKIRDPLIDLRLAAMPKVSQAHLAMLLAGAGVYLMLPIVMIAGNDERAAGLPFWLTGFLLVPYSVLSVAGARLGNRLRARIALPDLLLLGVCVYIVANAVLAFWHSNVWALVIGMSIAGIASGCTFAVIPQLIVQQVPAQATSSALSFNTLLRYIGFSVGSALCPVFIALADEITGGRDSFTLPFLAAGAIFVVGALMLLLRRRTAA